MMSPLQRLIVQVEIARERKKIVRRQRIGSLAMILLIVPVALAGNIIMTIICSAAVLFGIYLKETVVIGAFDLSTKEFWEKESLDKDE